MPDNDFTTALEEGMAAARRQRKTYTDAWAVEMDGEFFSLWLTESAANKVVDHYRQRSKARWAVAPVHVSRR